MALFLSAAFLSRIRCGRYNCGEAALSSGLARRPARRRQDMAP